VALQVAKSELALKQSQMSLEGAKIAVDDAKTAVANAQQDEKDAEQAVTDAQSDLDDANKLSPIITAPFDGYITKVNVAGGDAILKGKVAVEIADSSKFEADFNINEIDIYKVGLNTTATITPAALSTLALRGIISNISPTATTQSGVVNYAVVADIVLPQRSLLSPSGTSPQTGSSQGSQASSNQTATPRTPSSGAGGQTRQGQATSNQTAPQRPVTPQTGTGGQQSSNQSSQNTTGLLPQRGSALYGTANQTNANVQLRDGLSVSVSIVVASRTNVILVPNRAITRKSGNTTVNVVNNGVPQSRTIQIGINDLQNTEVISGLNEGEQVVVPQSTTTTTTTTQGGGGGGGGIAIPGLGRIGG
jgi:hypothetical protein